MTTRNHSLDDGIVQAAYAEFLAQGFQKASLHKIAENSRVTTRAIYTRYKNKDALFVSLLQNFLGSMEENFAPAVQEYEKARQTGTTEALLHAIDFEERIYMKLLTEHYDECTLFFSRSDGSCVVLCGGSGCGKSTLLRCLNGLIPQFYEGALKGFCRLNGQDTAGMSSGRPLPPLCGGASAGRRLESLSSFT